MARGSFDYSGQSASRPLREVFLERVIHIEAVQRFRAAAPEDDAAGFFEDGRLVGDPELADYRWSLDDPELFSRSGVIIIGWLSARSFEAEPRGEKTAAPPLRRAWDAAFERWRALIAALRNGTILATATHSVTGVRRPLDPVELARTGLFFDVHDSALLAKGRDGKFTELWVGITLTEASTAAVEAVSPEPVEEVFPELAETAKAWLADAWTDIPIEPNENHSVYARRLEGKACDAGLDLKWNVIRVRYQEHLKAQREAAEEARLKKR
jgi:hypothetical protein